MLELVLLQPTSVPNPNGESIGLVFFCTAHGKKSLSFAMGPVPLKIALPMGGYGPF